MSNEELYEVVGGKLTAAILNAFIRAFDTVLDFGRVVGTAIRRATEGKVCSL